MWQVRGASVRQREGNDGEGTEAKAKVFSLKTIILVFSNIKKKID